MLHRIVKESRVKALERCECESREGESASKPSPVLWKGQDGTVIVEGTMTALEPKMLLHFTVFDVRRDKLPVTAEDGITYEPAEQHGKTTLRSIFPASVCLIYAGFATSSLVASNERRESSRSGSAASSRRGCGGVTGNTACRTGRSA